MTWHWQLHGTWHDTLLYMTWCWQSLCTVQHVARAGGASTARRPATTARTATATQRLGSVAEAVSQATLAASAKFVSVFEFFPLFLYGLHRCVPSFLWVLAEVWMQWQASFVGTHRGLNPEIGYLLRFELGQPVIMCTRCSLNPVTAHLCRCSLRFEPRDSPSVWVSTEALTQRQPTCMGIHWGFNPETAHLYGYPLRL